MSTMLARVLESAARFAPKPRPPAVPPEPNYAGLVDILSKLYRLPDGLGETTLTREEASSIRRCGFAARAGCVWRCPLLPDELVWWNPLLAHLSDKVDPFWRPEGWRKTRALPRIVSRERPLARIEQKILAHLRREPYCMSKRRLQQKLWRLSGPFFNFVLDGLIREGMITYYRGLIYGYPRDAFAKEFNVPAEELKRQIRPSYTTPASASASSVKRR